MADPYAERTRAPVGEQPAGDGPAPELIASHGGLAARALADLDPARIGAAALVGIVVRDETLLPPIARIGPEFGVMLLVRPPDGARGAAVALEQLDSAAAEKPVLMVKQGLVGGPAEREGALALEPRLIDDLLDAAGRDRIEWEEDPDFGYEVAAAAPGVSGKEADALCPRLLYAAADRVYEHAEAVAELKRQRHRRISEIEGIDPRIVAATGWPIEPTGQSWKE